MLTIQKAVTTVNVPNKGINKIFFNPDNDAGR